MTIEVCEVEMMEDGGDCSGNEKGEHAEGIAQNRYNCPRVVESIEPVSDILHIPRCLFETPGATLEWLPFTGTLAVASGCCATSVVVEGLSEREAAMGSRWEGMRWS